MKKIQYKYSIITMLSVLVLFVFVRCERDLDELEQASYPTRAEVFIDGFSAGLEYEAWGDVTAFDVDKNVRFKGTESMRFAVPDQGETGGYAGGRFVTSVPRDLSGYNALTFWVKASKAATLDLVGFGNNAEGSKYLTSLKGIRINTNWEKVIIPIPNPSKLTMESGMFYYSEEPEEGAGYTFWIDELQFEKLGTIAHGKSEILKGRDKTEKAFSNTTYQVDSLIYTVNLPDGINQSIEIAPSYFTFHSSDTNIAVVDELGLVSIRTGGTAEITAMIKDEEAEGSLTIESSGAFVHAPAPEAEAEDVISLFSNAYTDFEVEYYNGYWEPYQTTLSADFAIDEDDVLNYYNFNFVGIQFTAPTIDASEMTHLHVDVFVTNEVSDGDKLQIRVVDMGADGTLADPNPTASYTLEGASLVSREWISLDIDISGMASKSKLAQVVFDNLGTSMSGFYADNIYFYDEGAPSLPTEPTEAAPVPTQDAGDVISIYSDAYTDITGVNMNPGWGQATVGSEVDFSGNNAFLYTGIDFQGIDFSSNNQDVSEMEYLHLDFWSANSTALNIYMISPGNERPYALTVPTNGNWTSVDIPLTEFSSVVDLSEVFQFKFDGNGDFYVDNLFFYKEPGGGGGGTEPSFPADTPEARDAADVVSIFSNAYTDVTVDTWSANWDDSDIADVQISGDDMKKISFTNFVGIDFSNNKLDVSEMTHFHMDFWTPDEVLDKSLTIKCVDFGGGSAEASNMILTVTHTANGDIPGLATGSWVTIDVPVAAFSGTQTRSDLAQIVMSSNLGTVYIDNLFFYKASGSPVTEPTEAAPAPTQDEGDVISIYSDTYTAITGVNMNPGWGQATVGSEVSVFGNNTFFYTGLNFQGIDFDANHQDVSGMDFLHLDFWSANSTSLKIYLISPGKETSYTLTVPTNGDWTSVDIPLTAFSSVVDLTDVYQFKFDGNGDFYLDNLFFYKGAGGGDTGPNATATTPPARNAGDVISFFSNAYTNVTVDSWSADWDDSDIVDVQISGDDSKKITFTNFLGINFSDHKLDASAMTHFHMDIWTPDEVLDKSFTVKCVDFGGGTAEATNMILTVTHTANGDIPAMEKGSWVSIDVPVTAFVGTKTRSDLAQIVITSNLNTVYIDNLYFYK